MKVQSSRRPAKQSVAPVKKKKEEKRKRRRREGHRRCVKTREKERHLARVYARASWADSSATREQHPPIYNATCNLLPFRLGGRSFGIKPRVCCWDGSLPAGLWRNGKRGTHFLPAASFLSHAHAASTLQITSVMEEGRGKKNFYLFVSWTREIIDVVEVFSSRWGRLAMTYFHVTSWHPTIGPQFAPPQSASPSRQGRTAEGTSPLARSFLLDRYAFLHKEMFARMFHFFARRIARPHFALSGQLCVLRRLPFLKPPDCRILFARSTLRD